jgi:hypothetical protein
MAWEVKTFLSFNWACACFLNDFPVTQCWWSRRPSPNRCWCFTANKRSSVLDFWWGRAQDSLTRKKNTVRLERQTTGIRSSGISATRKKCFLMNVILDRTNFGPKSKNTIHQLTDLVLGCGNWTMSADMLDCGLFPEIVSIDISKIVITQLQTNHV